VSSIRRTEPVPCLEFQAGLSWSPLDNQQLRLTAGYLIQSWWNVGEADLQSRADISAQGLFARCEWRY
jgi:hypothetical protein